MTDVNVYTSVNGDPSKDEIYFAGGDGGEALTGKGRGGSGGSISKVLAFNINDNPLSSDYIVIKAGDAGISLGAGSAGGGVSAATALAEDIEILAGAGSSGGNHRWCRRPNRQHTLSFSPTDRPEVLQIAGGTEAKAEAVQAAVEVRSTRSAVYFWIFPAGSRQRIVRLLPDLGENPCRESVAKEAACRPSDFSSPNRIISTPPRAFLARTRKLPFRLARAAMD